MPNRLIPIRAKLMKMLLLTSGIVLLFTAAFFYTYELATYRQSITRQLSTLGQAIAANSTAALAFDNASDAQTVLSAFKADRSIVAAALYDTSGKLFAFYPEKLAPAELPSAIGTDGYRSDGAYVIGFEPVAEGGRRLGTLFVKSDLSAIGERFRSYGLFTVLAIALAAMLAYFISHRQQLRISKPLLALAETARAVSDRHDYTVRAQRSRMLEVDTLTGAFNHMLEQIGRSDDHLRAQMNRLNLLQHITAAIGDRQDLPSIFNVVLRNVEENLPIDFGCICLHDAASDTLTVTTLGAASQMIAASLEMAEQTSVPIDGNGLSRCMLGQLVYEPDVRDIRFPFPQRLAKGGLCSLVIAPLSVESKVFGAFISARRVPHAFTSGDCEFLKQLSQHVALAAHQTQLYNALQSAYDDLRQSQQTMMQQERLRALGQMASGIAHDINNALSPVSLYTESLLEREPGLSDRARSTLTIIQRAIDDVAGTVARMREFYRPRETQVTLRAVDLNRMVEQVIELTRARWLDVPQQRGAVIELRKELDPDLPEIMGAEVEIRDALTNLVLNAADAMPEGGTLTLRTDSVQVGSDGRLVRVAVIDTGNGMDEEIRRRCLEPFFTTKGERGTGLGLAMVYGMVQRHSGELQIDSSAGKGTTMRLVFPAYAQTFHETVRMPAASFPQRRMRVLLIDDDPLIIKAMQHALEADGHTTVAASGGQAGIDAFAAARGTHAEFTLVFTDLGMPGVDGRRVANAIKSLSPRTPVIMLTGWGQRMLADNDIPPNVDRVLSKPPRLHEVRLAIRELAE